MSAQELAPPWSAFPRIPWGSAGWRMGFGEVHWNRWMAWYAQASPTTKSAYKASWPEPAEWLGFFDFVENGTLPPWLVERERLVAAAAIPPSAEEREVREPYRMQWMLRSYLKRPKAQVRLLEYGVGHSVYRDPYGEAWCLAEPRNGTTDVYLYRYAGELIGEDNLPVELPIP